MVRSRVHTGNSALRQKTTTQTVNAKPSNKGEVMGYTAEQALFFDGGIKVGHHINLSETNENLDDWVSLGDFDLNVWQSGDNLCLTVYPAKNGNTDTTKHLFSIQLEKGNK